MLLEGQEQNEIIFQECGASKPFICQKEQTNSNK